MLKVWTKTANTVYDKYVDGWRLPCGLFDYLRRTPYMDHVYHVILDLMTDCGTVVRKGRYLT